MITTETKTRWFLVDVEGIEFYSYQCPCTGFWEHESEPRKVWDQIVVNLEDCGDIDYTEQILERFKDTDWVVTGFEPCDEPDPSIDWSEIPF